MEAQENKGLWARMQEEENLVKYDPSFWTFEKMQIDNPLKQIDGDKFYNFKDDIKRLEELCENTK